MVRLNFIFLVSVISVQPFQNEEYITKEVYSPGIVVMKYLSNATVSNPFDAQFLHLITFTAEHQSVVKKGDIILEVDKARILKRIDEVQQEIQTAQINLERAVNEILKLGLDENYNMDIQGVELEKKKRKFEKFKSIEDVLSVLKYEQAINQAATDSKVAERNYEFSKQLLEKDLIPQIELEKSQNELVKAKNAFEKAGYDLKEYTDYTRVKTQFELEEGIRQVEATIKTIKSTIEADVNKNEIDKETAEKQVKDWKKELKALNKDLNNTVIRSDFDGQIEFFDPMGMKPGTMVDKWTPPFARVITISNNSIDVETNIAPPDFNYVTKDSDVTIWFLSNPNESFKGKVTLALTGGEDRWGFPRPMWVLCSMDNPPSWLKFSMRVILKFTTKVPKSYLTENIKNENK
ncbi:MAG: hypothetical protein HY606_13715 [Planctomycetes bacterium]|nr:hypothetical protein [Planctomycetota bacterium]